MSVRPVPENTGWLFTSGQVWFFGLDTFRPKMARGKPKLAALLASASVELSNWQATLITPQV